MRDNDFIFRCYILIILITLIELQLDVKAHTSNSCDIPRIYQYMRSDMSIGHCYPSDSMKLKNATVYVITDLNSANKGLVIEAGDSLYMLVPTEYKYISFTPISRYCHLSTQFSNSFYDIYEDKYIRSNSSNEEAFIKGRSAEHGDFISEGRSILFEDGTVIQAPSEEHSLKVDSSSNIVVVIGNSEYLLDERDISSIWTVNSILMTNDTYLGDFVISGFVNNSIAIATSPDKRESIVLEYDENSYDTTHIPTYEKITPISKTEKYIFGQKEDSICFVYDWINAKEYKLKNFGFEHKVDEVSYLGKRKGEPIFLVDKYWLVGTNGFYCSLENGWRIDPKMSEVDKKVYIRLDETSGVYSKLNDFQNGKILTSVFQPEDICEDEIFVRNPDIEESYPYDRSRFFCQISKLKYPKDLRRHVLYWISECINLSSGYEMLIPSESTTEKEFLDYYKRQFISGLNDSDFLWGGLEAFTVEKTLETDDLVSFTYSYENHLGGGTGYEVSLATIFSKKNNTRLILQDIVSAEADPIIENYLRTEISYWGSDSLINTCVALCPEGIIFTYGRYTSFASIGEEFLVPFSLIEDWLLIDINNKDRIRTKLVFVDQMEEEENPNDEDDILPQELSLDLRQRYLFKSPLYSDEDLTYELSINKGNNRANAIKLFDNDPQKSLKIIKRLSSEYASGGRIFSYYRELMQQANIACAKQCIKNKNIAKAKSYIETVLSTADYIPLEHRNYKVDAYRLLSDIASLYSDTVRLLEYQKEISSTLPSYIQESFYNLSRIERNKIWTQYRDWFFSEIQNAAFITRDSILLEAAFDALLFGKGALLNAEIAVRKNILRSGNEKLYNKLIELDKLKENKIKVERYGNKETLDDISHNIEILEKALEEETQYMSYIFHESIKMKHISSCLFDGEVAIEFVETKFENDTVYYALILRNGAKAPVMRKLCSISKIKNLAIEDYFSDTIYNVIWKYLENDIAGCKKIFFSPCGKLYTIPIEYARLPSLDKCINDEYDIYRLSSTREIVVARDSTFNIKSFGDQSLLVGGLDYDAHDAPLQLKAKEDAVSQKFRSAFSHRTKVRYLPGTRDEILEIIPFVREIYNTDSVIVLSESKGTEACFRTTVGKNISNLHIATHGFYITNEDMSRPEQEIFLSLLEKQIRDIEEHTLIRSGLFFAGINNTLHGDDIAPYDNDGILSTLEIGMLNLFNIDLAVLSACSTGDGDVSYDGVYGLQRGFKKAGVNSLMLSLWPVDDDATRILMVKFYDSLSKNNSKQASLREAMHYLMGYDKGKYSAPVYWAAFILLDAID